MTEVNTKSMQVEKGINADLQDLAKYLDNLTLRTKDENDKISNDDLLNGKAFNAGENQSVGEKSK